jgi:hypothetical protein
MDGFSFRPLEIAKKVINERGPFEREIKIPKSGMMHGNFIYGQEI